MILHIQLTILFLSIICTYVYFLRDYERRFKKYICYAAMLLIANIIALFTTSDFYSALPWYLYGTIPYLVIFILTIFMHRMPYTNAIYNTVIYYLVSDCLVHTIRHFNMVSFKNDFLYSSSFTPFFVIEVVLLTIILFLVFRLIASLFYDRKAKISGNTVILSLVSCLPLFLMGHIEEWLALEQEQITMTVSLVGLLISYSSLTAVVGTEALLENKLREEEVAQLEAMLHAQYQQYVMRKETIDELNQKYHDLKHHVLALANSSTKEKDFYYKEILEKIGTYEKLYQSGNDIVDVIINEKSMICQREKIDLRCNIKPHSLDMMRPIDISTIISNALDNAIEAELQVADLNKRFINFKITSDNYYITMSFENYYEHELNLSDNQFLTTKTQKGHGYGIKGIKMCVEKYGGNFTITPHDNMFALNIIIPLTK